MFRHFIIACGVALLFGCTSGGDRLAASAADFKLEDLNGKTVSLSDFRGKPVLIDFWATWCFPCREAIPEIEKLYKNYSGKGLVVLGVSIDSSEWESVRAFAKEAGITYPVLKGDEDVTTRFQVRAIPMVVILDKQGKVVKRYFGIGSDGELEKGVKAILAASNAAAPAAK